LVYLNPCPSEKALDFFYAFINYYSIIPINSINKLDQRLIRKSNILRSQILKNFKHIDKTTSILDVGAGVGSFAIYLKKKFNCNVFCSDKDLAAVDFINKSYPEIHTISGDFKKIEPKYKFDIITMWGFLEHEFDPVGTLRLAREMLKPNGIIILDVPNVKGNLAKKNIKNWPFLHSPYHICHYNLDTLSKIIEQVGFHFVHSENKKTGAFLLKYSDQILSIIYKYNLFYSSKYVDFIFYLLSRIFMKGEANSDSRIIIIGQK
jgi:2-polyprenyl-3-methyl-5-hydroxy-6-metoxy-1,4-benzoquinol methylase